MSKRRTAAPKAAPPQQMPLRAVNGAPPRPNITTDLVLVTPALATELLSRNLKNRRVRTRRVTAFIAILRAGRWESHHQGIALDVEGNLLDGQHRLMAIRDSGVSAWMNVSRGVSRTAYHYIDTHATRSVEDATGISGRVSGVANCLLRVALGSHPPRHLAIEAVIALQEECDELDAACSTARRGLSSAPVRAAAIASAIAQGDSTYPFLMYRALVCRQFEDMPPIVSSLFKQLVDSERNLKRGYDEASMLFARAFLAFEQKNAQTTRIQIKELDRYRNIALAVLRKKGVSVAHAMPGGGT